MNNYEIKFLSSKLGWAASSRDRLVLPANQREYAWKEDHVRQLLEDFAKAISDDGNDYFLGTIVTIPREDGVF